MVSRKGGLVLWTMLAVVLIVFMSGAVAVYTVFLKPENTGRVPLFRESSVSDAVAEAERLGLVVQIEPVASTLPAGRVLAQTPEVGTELRKGQVVVLQVSQGGELYAVPNVQGKTLAQAQTEIKENGFALGDVIRIAEPNVKAGTVIAQSPSAPAQVASGRKIDLLVQDGTAAADVVTIPDVNRMTESEARSVLEAGGLKVSAVDRVYSPLLPEGLAIETRPGAGMTIRAGQGVTLKLATQKRPAGFMDSDATSTQTANGTARRVTSQPANTASTPAQSKPAQTQTPARSVTVSVPGQKDVVIGGSNSGTQARTQTQAATQQASRPSTTTTTTPRTASTAATQPAQTQTTQTPAAASTGGNKTARIRYQVPPIARPMELRIELTDPAGKRDVFKRQVRSGESVNTTAKYTQECVISIYLGGEFVWQERQK